MIEAVSVCVDYSDHLDVTCDNINVLDLVLTVSSVLGYGNLTSDQALAADINMDGTVNIIDVTMIIDMLFAN